jgi:uncharacterized protein DUF3800
MYVDDSGSPSLKGGAYYVLCGVIIHESQLQDIERKVRHYKETNFNGFMPTNKEIHTYYMYNGGGDFKNIDYQSRLLLLKNLYFMINEIQIKIISIGIRAKCLSRLGTT